MILLLVVSSKNHIYDEKLCKDVFIFLERGLSINEIHEKLSGNEYAYFFALNFLTFWITPALLFGKFVYNIYIKEFIQDCNN